MLQSVAFESQQNAYSYTFGHKEEQNEFGLEWLDFGARCLARDIGRWVSVDLLADTYNPFSPYNYTLNNPLKFIDPDGMRVSLFDKMEELGAYHGEDTSEKVSPNDIIINGSDGNSFNWTQGAKYTGKDKFIQQTVLALNALSKDKNTANFSFKGKSDTGIVFEGNAVLDYVKGGVSESKDVIIESADKNPQSPGENQHITGTIYWNPNMGIAEEGFNGAKGGGAFPSMGILLHELGHAALYNEYGGEDWQDRTHIFAAEERMIIDRLEATGMRTLGFGTRSGTSHNTYANRKDAINNNQGGINLTKSRVIVSYYIPSPSPIFLKK